MAVEAVSIARARPLIGLEGALLLQGLDAARPAMLVGDEGAPPDGHAGLNCAS
jgi:hypothetical protein